MDKISFYEHLLQRMTHWLPFYFCILIVAETIFLLVRFKKVFGKETRVNLVTGFVSIVAQGILKTVLLGGVYPAVYEHRLFELGLEWPAWMVGFLMYVFIQFGTHLLYHKVRLFWCLHEVHHSATEMNITTGLRTSVFDVVSLDLFYLLIPLLGVHPLVYFILYTMNKFWGTFLHISDKIAGRIRLLEYLVVTPSAHQVHHARNVPYLDKNYGEVVPWFDMLFGTFIRETEKPVYGTLKVQQPIGFWESQLHEMKSLWKDIKASRNWKHKLGYLLMPPGWQPGNFRQTAQFQQKKWQLQLRYKRVDYRRF
jgi:sterol desaturase/sphingolipid hydroxylase (fatty acid hydroxylase superfamily)